MDQIVLALALISFSPSDDTQILNDAERLLIGSHARLAQEFAVSAELLDRREMRYVLSKPEDFAADLNLLRRRNFDLCDSPCVVDSQRFPDRATVNDVLMFNRAYHTNLENMQALSPVYSLELQRISRRTDELYAVWDAVRDSRCEYFYVTVRRQALKRLREQIGDEAYFLGAMPSPVPLEYFQEIK